MVGARLVASSPTMSTHASVIRHFATGLTYLLVSQNENMIFGRSFYRIRKRNHYLSTNIIMQCRAVGVPHSMDHSDIDSHAKDELAQHMPSNPTLDIWIQAADLVDFCLSS